MKSSNDSSCYYLDLTHSLNCATIESAKANKAQNVLVRNATNPAAPAISAIGTLSADGKVYFVVIPSESEDKSFDLEWDDLKKTIEYCRSKL